MLWPDHFSVGGVWLMLPLPDMHCLLSGRFGCSLLDAHLLAGHIGRCSQLLIPYWSGRFRCSLPLVHLPMWRFCRRSRPLLPCSMGRLCCTRPSDHLLVGRFGRCSLPFCRLPLGRLGCCSHPVAAAGAPCLRPPFALRVA